MMTDEKAFRYLLSASDSLSDPSFDAADPDSLRARLPVASRGEEVMIRAALALCPWAEEQDFTLSTASRLDAGNLDALLTALAILACHEEVMARPAAALQPARFGTLPPRPPEGMVGE